MLVDARVAETAFQDRGWNHVCKTGCGGTCACVHGKLHVNKDWLILSVQIDERTVKLARTSQNSQLKLPV
jgi:hypothetical protein